MTVDNIHFYLSLKSLEILESVFATYNKEKGRLNKWKRTECLSKEIVSGKDVIPL